MSDGFQTMSAVLAKWQIRAMEAIRQREMEREPHRRVSMSDVIREALAEGLAIVAEREGVDMEAAETEQVPA